MLRARLFLNLIPFVVILLAVGAFAIVLFARLAHKVDVTVMENYRCAIAARDMSLALSRMDIGLRFAMDGDKISAASLFDECAQLSEASLAILVTNKHLFKETELIALLQTNYAELHKTGASILGLAQRREPSESLQKARKEETDRLLALKLLLERTGQINHANILATTESNRAITRHITRLMIAALAVAFLVCAFASFQLSKSILH